MEALDMEMTTDAAQAHQGAVRRRDETPQKLGRRQDRSRDADILKATADVLAEVGYEGMTVDAVAARAKAGKATVYRRWPTKADLVLDAISHMKQARVDLAHLPDTGTLRGDLLALFKPEAIGESDYKLRVMAGLISMLSQHPKLAEAGHAVLIEPWATAHRILMKRAIDRGEIAPHVDVESLAQIIPVMAAYRSLILHRPFDLAFLVSLVDGALLPALRNGATCRVTAGAARRR